MRILVTGAAGFVGRQLVPRLRDQHDLRVLMHSRPRDFGPSVEAFKSDLIDRASLEPALQDVDMVVHLAFITGDRPNHGNLYERVNVDGTRNLLDSCRTAGVRRVLLLGGINTHQAKPGSYLQGRWQAEQLLRKSGCQWSIIRPSVLFGPAAPFFVILRQLVLEFPLIPLLGGGRTLFQPMHVDDLVECICSVVNRISYDRHVWEVGGPEHLSFRQLVEMTERQLGIHKPKVSVPMGIAAIQARLMQALPRPPLTPAIIDLLSEDNITSIDSVAKNFGFEPRSLTAEMAAQGRVVDQTK